MFHFPIHSPIQEITYNVPGGYKLYIKRDDLIDPLISGNKWRKLKFQLEDAHQQHKKTLVSFGGAYSNHLLALASAAAKFGFKSVGIVRGDELRKSSETLVFCQMLGMEIIPVSREEYKHKQALFEHYFGKDTTAYFIDEGGFSALGAKGCEELITELEEEYSDVFIAAGTACTTAGIINAIKKNNLHTHVHSVVVHNGLDEIQQNLTQLLLPDTKYSLLDTKEHGRYAQHSPELLTFCIDFQQHTGILLDPIYTGKALYACYQWMKQTSNTATTKHLLFVHTGGILGNLGKLNVYEEFIRNKTS
jgi:1-aminocyclopropane-1-carboxylate deaminase